MIILGGKNHSTPNKVFREILILFIVHHIFVYNKQRHQTSDIDAGNVTLVYYFAEPEVMQWYHKFSWVLYNISITTALSVTVTYWAFLSGGMLVKTN